MADAPDLHGDRAVVVPCFKCGGSGKKFVKLNRKRRRRGRDGAAIEEPLQEVPADAEPVEGQRAVYRVTCTVCGGGGSIVDGARQAATAAFAQGACGRVKPLVAPPGWTAPGPRPFAERGGEQPSGEVAPGMDGEPVDLCMLCGSWRIFQEVRGHRYSTDDLVTAWYAGRVLEWVRPEGPPARTLDLGCGIGSVLLMTAWRYPTARCTGVEAQRPRHHLAQRSAAYNDDPSTGRIRVVLGDLRDTSGSPADADQPASAATVPAAAAAAATAPDSPDSVAAVVAGRGPFELVTGTPPYWHSDKGALPPSISRARCLYEFFGGVEDYCVAAAPLLSPDRGVFVVCAAATSDARVAVGAAAAGLAVLSCLRVVPRRGKPPLFTVYALCARPQSDAWRAQGLQARPLCAQPDLSGSGVSRCGWIAATADDADDADDPAARRGAGGRAGAAAALRVLCVEEELVVREASGERSAAYARLMQDMGKPVGGAGCAPPRAVV